MPGSPSPGSARSLGRPELLSPDDVLQFQRDGFLVVRDVLRADEVAQLRGAIERHTARAKELGQVLRPTTDELVPVTDILGMPGVGWLLSDPRILGVARRLIGRADLVYFGDSSVMVGGKNRGFHKDNAVRDTTDHPDWLSPYTLIRMGVYLEDHKHHSGGLKVRRGSHLHADVTSGAIVDVPSQRGDVVVWSLRTTHSGFAVRVRGLSKLGLQPRFEGRLPAWLARPEPCVRIAVFMTFGIDDHHLRNYVAKHTDQASYPDNYVYQSWLFSDGTAATARTLAEAGVTLLRPIPEYGSRFGLAERIPGGCIIPGRSRPDVYRVRGLEKWIQRAGRAMRSLARPR